jgi:DNA-binding NarL/FixJ family response regulator
MPGASRPDTQGCVRIRAGREIVALVAEGLNNEEVATRLVISPATARTHVSRAMVKLGARDRAQLVVFAYQSGLVQ